MPFADLPIEHQKRSVELIASNRIRLKGLNAIELVQFALANGATDDYLLEIWTSELTKWLQKSSEWLRGQNVIDHSEKREGSTYLCY